jgi:hypothetical protein
VSDIKIFISVLVVGAILVIGAANTGIFPQVISCANQHPAGPTSNPDWQPPLRVEVEPNRDPGRVREYRAFGCTAYYYFAHFK